MAITPYDPSKRDKRLPPPPRRTLPPQTRLAPWTNQVLRYPETRKYRYTNPSPPASAFSASFNAEFK